MGLARFLTDAFLTIPSTGYYAVQKIREKAYENGLFSSAKANIPVISIGNLLMGGSGKTPAVIFLADMLFREGLKPVIVSRGYRGRYREPFLVVSDGIGPHPTAGPDVAGDEPYLIARRLPHIPVVVGRKRIHPVRAAIERFQGNVVILDDGFQHLALKRDTDIVLINGLEDRMFPLGRLREPFSALRRADILVLMGRTSSIPPSACKHARRLPVFRCEQIASGLMQDFSTTLISPAVYKGRPVLLASAIANAGRFCDLALELGWNPVEHKVFADHHVFTDIELQGILEDAGGAPVVVTEKDWVKLPEWFKNTGRAAALRIELVFEQQEAFLRTVLHSIGAFQK